jgi:hypothetical protein
MNRGQVWSRGKEPEKERAAVVVPLKEREDFFDELESASTGDTNPQNQANSTLRASEIVAERAPVSSGPDLHLFSGEAIDDNRTSIDLPPDVEWMTATKLVSNGDGTHQMLEVKEEQIPPLANTSTPWHYWTAFWFLALAGLGVFCPLCGTPLDEERHRRGPEVEC